MTINSRSSLKTIKSLVMDDFGIKLDDQDAKEIREAKSHGSILWTASKLVNTAVNARVRRIEPGKIVYGMATYTAKEWNS